MKRRSDGGKEEVSFRVELTNIDNTLQGRSQDFWVGSRSADHNRRSGPKERDRRSGTEGARAGPTSEGKQETMSMISTMSQYWSDEGFQNPDL